jgi:hypothetical protein
MRLRPKGPASTEQRPRLSIACAAPALSRIDFRAVSGCRRFTRARLGESRDELGVGRSIWCARFQPDDAAAEYIGVDGVRARAEQAERRATACTRNHRDRAVAAGHERGSDGRGGEHECDDSCAKPQCKRKRKSGRNDYGDVWRELWGWKARDHEECNPRASQSQQHQGNSGGAVGIARQRLHHHHDTGCLRRR